MPTQVVEEKISLVQYFLVQETWSESSTVLVQLLSVSSLSLAPCFLLLLWGFYISLLAGPSWLKTALKTSLSAPPSSFHYAPARGDFPSHLESFGQQEPCKPAQAVDTSGWGQAEAGAASLTGPPSLESILKGNWSLGKKVLKWWPGIWYNLLIGKRRASAYFQRRL